MRARCPSASPRAGSSSSSNMVSIPNGGCTSSMPLPSILPRSAAVASSSLACTALDLRAAAGGVSQQQLLVVNGLRVVCSGSRVVASERA